MSQMSKSIVRGRGATYYRQLLSEQSASGLSLRAFAAERGLSQWTLYGWRGRLGRAGPGRVAARREKRAAKEAGFVAVDVMESSSTTSEIEVVLADGLRVLVPRDTTTERLVELVRALRSC